MQAFLIIKSRPDLDTRIRLDFNPQLWPLLHMVRITNTNLDRGDLHPDHPILPDPLHRPTREERGQGATGNKEKAKSP